MIVWGGTNSAGGGYLNTGGRYAPVHESLDRKRRPPRMPLGAKRPFGRVDRLENDRVGRSRGGFDRCRL
jgi:hypothetical protein